MHHTEMGSLTLFTALGVYTIREISLVVSQRFIGLCGLKEKLSSCFTTKTLSA